MLEKLARIEARYEELNQLMAAPEIVTDHDRVRAYAQEQADLEALVQKYRQYQATTQSLAETRLMLDDDPDEDGKTNLEEYILGTDPNQFNYYFHFPLFFQ